MTKGELKDIIRECYEEVMNESHEIDMNDPANKAKYGDTLKAMNRARTVADTKQKFRDSADNIRSTFDKNFEAKKNAEVQAREADKKAMYDKLSKAKAYQNSHGGSLQDAMRNSARNF